MSSSKNPNGVALSDAYPANSILELTLSPNNEVVQGLVYCTDEISNSIVLKKSLNYTTLASEIRVINASCVKAKKIIAAQAPKSRIDGVTEVQEVAIALPNVTKKSIEEREKRAIMLAQESLKHINQKVSTKCLGSFISILYLFASLNSFVFNFLRSKGEYGRTDCI
jgi:hypothetical protein